jgi:hypothetical protein
MTRVRASVAKNGALQNFLPPTAQAKLISVANAFGNTGIKKQQGSSLIVYDCLPLTEGLNQEQTLKFFKNVNTRQFPFTNISENKLQVGEAMVLERMYFAIISQLDATGEITNVQTFDAFATPAFYKSDFEIKQVNNTVVKPAPLTSMKPEFNREAKSTTYNVFHFDTDITLQPLLQFEVDLNVPEVTIPTSATLSFYMMCAIEGAGAIMNPKYNF